MSKNPPFTGSVSFENARCNEDQLIAFRLRFEGGQDPTGWTECVPQYVITALSAAGIGRSSGKASVYARDCDDPIAAEYYISGSTFDYTNQNNFHFYVDFINKTIAPYDPPHGPKLTS